MVTTDSATQHLPSTAIGTVEGIFVATVARGPMHGLELVQAEAGRGLEGDRYFDGEGTYSDFAKQGRHVTLIQAEALEALRNDYDIDLAGGANRRNLVTRGVTLLDLVGKRFWVGEALFEGVMDCPPCTHLAKLTQGRMVIEGLVHSGGLRANIVQSGVIRVGDSIRLAE